MFPIREKTGMFAQPTAVKTLENQPVKKTNTPYLSRINEKKMRKKNLVQHVISAKINKLW